MHYYSSKQTFENKYRYILAFIKFLDNKDLLKNTFKDIDIDCLFSKSLFKQEFKLEDSISKDEILELFSHLEISRNSLRNKIILTLLLYGFDIEDIITLTDNQINFKNSIINIKNKTFKMTPNLSLLLKKHLDNKRKSKINFKYTLYTKHDNTLKQIKYNTLNEIINHSFNNLTVDENRKKQLNIKAIKLSLLKDLYDNGYSLEEISYLTNISIPTILNHIDEDKLSENGRKVINKINKNHPYASLL